MTILPPTIRNGLESVCNGRYVKANDKGEVSSDWFNKKTLILGYDKKNKRGDAEALFTFNMPSRKILGNVDTTVTLTIEAERIHAGLHSHLGPKMKKAVIEVNGNIVDYCWLIQKMPNGEDYGMRNVGPIPIDRVFLTRKNLTVSLKIEEDMAWDIDKVILNITTGMKKLTTLGGMIAGAVISVIIGLLPVVLEKILIPS